VWLHTVSLGELRSAQPLIDLLLQNNNKVIITCFTAAGRSATESLYQKQIAQKQLFCCWVPFDLTIFFRLFFYFVKPKYGMILEVELWPRMITASKKCGMQLYAVNAQYPEQSLKRDLNHKIRRLRTKLVQHLAGIVAKSARHQQAYRKLGQQRVAVGGELRFEQAIPQWQIEAANNLRQQIGRDRFIVCLASVVKDEQQHYFEVIRQLCEMSQKQSQSPPLFVFVPRAADQFTIMNQQLHSRFANRNIDRRSQMCNDELQLTTDKQRNLDILIGDSYGEMYFYQQLADICIIGGGFHPKGAHNIIETLTLGRMPFVGPNIWTIDFPAQEAIASGVLQYATTVTQMAEQIDHFRHNKRQNNLSATLQFAQQYSGASGRIVNQIQQWQSQ